MSKSSEKQIVEKLDQILKVLSIQAGTDMGLTERARLLKLAGLDNQTIAEVLNVSVTTVRILTSNRKRQIKKQQ
jgi:DNA-binding NarL/FixJ family response regulator